MTRICFHLQVRPELIDEYIEIHRSVWPQMLRAIEDSGRSNYSLFLRDDGLLVGYYETDDDAESARRLAEDSRTKEWEEQAQRFFVALEGGRADQGAPVLREVFNLEEQIASLDAR
ncbi:L-rhamnose mutarotase [Demequina aurantiaca]|uniref:L-rhamnose mutarotase n=1 Tax=Demequina aurantiaca TaxID=676200 RepID=UPI00078519A5|nr:L-rhamnose mutarotase [Demequina aurantiaca]